MYKMLTQPLLIIIITRNNLISITWGLVKFWYIYTWGGYIDIKRNLTLIKGKRISMTDC